MNIRVRRINKLGPLENLPKSVEPEEDGDTNISREEVGNDRGVPFVVGKDGEAIEEDDTARPQVNSTL